MNTHRYTSIVVDGTLHRVIWWGKERAQQALCGTILHNLAYPIENVIVWTVCQECKRIEESNEQIYPSTQQAAGRS